MKKRMNFNPYQQQVIAQAISAKLDMMTISWTNEMRIWHHIALKALEFAGCHELEIDQRFFKKLMETNTHGIQANVVAILCNNIERRSANQMEVSLERWNAILEMNQGISDHWNAVTLDSREDIMDAHEEMFKPKNIVVPGDKKIITMGQA